MSKLKRSLYKKSTQWALMMIVFLITAATVYAVVPIISLSSPTSFPVDI